jgi:rRNA maturation endonuclease Nob1
MVKPLFEKSMRELDELDDLTIEYIIARITDYYLNRRGDKRGKIVGNWIKTANADKKGHIIYKCSNCDYETTINELYFCPKCGIEIKRGGK